MFSVVNKNRLLIIAISFIALFSLAHSFYYKIRVSVDALAYDQTGWNIVRGNGYVEDARNAATPERDNAIARVGPGYQFFLALVYFLFGHTIWVVWVAQAILRAVTAYLVYRIAQKLFQEEASHEYIALLAVFLYGFMPDLVILNSMLFTETIAIFLLAFSIFLLFRYCEAPSVMRATGLMITLTLAFLTRTTFILFIPAIFIIFAFQKRWAHLLISISIIAVIVAPWVLYNKKIFGEIIFTNAVGGYDLWVGNNPDATGGFVKSPAIQAVRDKNHIVQLSKIGIQRYQEFLLTQPGAFILLQARKASMYFSLLRPTGFWPYLNKRPLDQIIVVSLSVLWSGFLLVVGVTGIYLATRKFFDNIQMRLFALFAVLQPASVIPVIIESRYRAPLFLFLAIGAAYAVIVKTPNRKKALIIVIVFFVLATLVDLGCHWGEFRDRLSLLVS
jgi:hypothetical protein